MLFKFNGSCHSFLFFLTFGYWHPAKPLRILGTFKLSHSCSCLSSYFLEYIPYLWTFIFICSPGSHSGIPKHLFKVLFVSYMFIKPLYPFSIGIFFNTLYIGSGGCGGSDGMCLLSWGESIEFLWTASSTVPALLLS